MIKKIPYTAPPQEVTIPGNEYIEQRNYFSLTMNIHNFAKYPTKRRDSTMLATRSWRGPACSYSIHKLTRLSVARLTKLFHSARNFPSVALQ